MKLVKLEEQPTAVQKANRIYSSSEFNDTVGWIAQLWPQSINARYSQTPTLTYTQAALRPPPLHTQSGRLYWDIILK